MKLIPKILILFALLSLASQQARSQTPVDSSMLEKFQLDFSVPDMPAFKALGVDPSDILRPSEVKKFAAMISPFYTNGKAVIPKNFALEFAPWRIASSKWTLEDYNKQGIKRFLYNSAFSLGTIRDSGQESSKVAIGYRVSILSREADVYRAALIREKIFDQQDALFTALQYIQNDWVGYVIKPIPAERHDYYEKHKTEFYKYFSGIKEYLKKNPDATMQQHYDAFVDTYKKVFRKEPTGDELLNINTKWNNDVNDFIEDYKKNYWNASRFDLAIAWLGQSNDTLIKNTGFSSLSLWSAYAIRLGKGKQLVIGVNGTLPRSENKDSARFNITGNARLYLGSQDFRGFVEGQYKYKRFETDERSALINLGAEFRLGEKFWIMASAGVNNYLKEKDPFSKLVSSIDIRYFFDKARK